MAKVGTLILETEIDTKQFDKQITEVEQQIKNIEFDLSHKKELNLDTRTIKEYEVQLEKLNNKLVDLKKKKQEAQEPKIDEEGGGFSGLGGIIKKITKIGLGLVGLRMGMALLRNSVSMVSSQNDEIATKINTIKSAIANALTPVVQVVVNLFAKLLAYAGYILNKWFGIDIFAKSTANSTKKSKNNLGGMNKEATKLKRTLAGFDEMNILQKDGGVASGGGGGGISQSDIDMDLLKDIEIPDWIKWIADNKDEILSKLLAIGSALAMIMALAKGIELGTKAVKLADALSKIKDHFEGMSNLQIFGVLAGSAVTLAGIVKLVTDLITGNTNLVTILQDLSIVLTGIGIILISLNASNPFGWVITAIGFIGSLITSLIDTRTEEEKLEETKNNLAEAQKNVNKAYQDYINASNTHLQAYRQVQKAQQNVTKTAKDLGISEDKLNDIGEDLFEGIRNGTYDIEKLGDEETGLTKKYGLQEEQLLKIYEAYVDLRGSKAKLVTATDDLTTSETKYTDAQKEEYARNLQNQVQLYKTTGEYEKLGKAMELAYKSGAVSAEEMSFILGNVLSDMDEETRKTFIKTLPNSVKTGVMSIEDSIMSFTAKKYIIKFGANTTDAEKAINNVINKIKQLKTGAFTVKYGTSGNYAKGGIVGFAKGGILNLPKLAPGGLINRPGPGVAIAGERGTEGVVPLTDSQQMDRLGMAIGRYVNIRAEIPISVGNRQIAREIRNINADESFAFNG